MSNVSDILSGITTILIATLPADWQELEYVYEDTVNSARNNQNRYGAGVGEAVTVSGVTKAVTLNQTFFVKLTVDTANRSSDDSERTAINNLYAQMELVETVIFQQKLGVPDKVLLVSDLSLDAPERIGNNTLMLKMSFLCQHRRAT